MSSSSYKTESHMKKTLFFSFLLVVATLWVGCGSDSDDAKTTTTGTTTTQSTTEQPAQPAEETKQDEATTQAGDDLVAIGKKLFTDKTCATCHAPDKKLVGPSIQDIAKIYADKGASIVDFLKQKSKPIVDTDPGQVSVMKANLDGFVKDMKDDELKALEAYMMSVK